VVGTRVWASVLTGIISCAIFAAIASIHLDAQGLYQDELFQAKGAFTYVGGPPRNALAVFGIPLLKNWPPEDTSRLGPGDFLELVPWP
jgi:hypothetical protein